MCKIKILLIVLLISSVYANPYIETLINEFQTAPDSLERIELHALPMPLSVDLGGWTITTRAGIATINPGTILPYDGYIRIDRTNTSGIFRLDDIQDTINLYHSSGIWMDGVCWHFLPAHWKCAPAPPYGGSSSLYRPPEIWWGINPINWYIDSTPTFDEPNNDWSSISGKVLNQNQQPLINFEIYASGPAGSSSGESDSSGNYIIGGLGEGEYWLTVYDEMGLRGNYPESVFVSYNQHITDIDIILPFSEIEEPIKSIATTSVSFFSNPIKDNSKISFILPEKAKAIIRIYDAKGILIRTLFNGTLNAGKNQFKLNLNTNPGVYFLNYQIGEQKAITKKLTYLK